MTADLAAFLSARLDDVERLARDARKDGSGCWELIAHKRGDGAVYDDMGNPVLEYDTDPATGIPARSDLNPLGARQAAHIAAHDPDRVLAEVDAKRRTIVRCEEALLSASPMLVHFAQQTLREMALPHARHPDFPPDA